MCSKKLALINRVDIVFGVMNFVSRAHKRILQWSASEGRLGPNPRDVPISLSSVAARYLSTAAHTRVNSFVLFTDDRPGPLDGVLHVRFRPCEHATGRSRSRLIECEQFSSYPTR